MAGSASYSDAGEPIPRKSLAQNVVDPLGIEGILECHDGIVSEGDKGTSARNVAAARWRGGGVQVIVDSLAADPELDEPRCW
jgi:hypothetical protein